jgi:hypothetical protein
VKSRSKSAKSSSTSDEFSKLIGFLERLPSIKRFEHPSPPHFNTGRSADGNWWITFRIDIDDELAWDMVQQLSFVLNCAAINDPLPTRFMPYAPPPENGGGPKALLYWEIASTDRSFSPDDLEHIIDMYIFPDRDILLDYRKECVPDLD